MNNLWAECIEQDDTKKQVLHQVHTTVDGEKYKLTFKALCPMTAIAVAREVPLKYWEKEND